MKILISGASGLIGKSITDYFRKSGHDIRLLVRRQTNAADEIPWEAVNQSKESFEGFDVVIHLSGESIGAKRWTKTQRDKIRSSRIDSTYTLAKTLSRLSAPPELFLCASAIGIYGNRGSEELTEASDTGHSFLAAVCQDWEDATEPARKAGIRVVNMRFSMVLSLKGGGLKSLRTIFRFGLGGRIGHGKQYMAWISIEDIPPVIDFLITQKSINGPVNMAAPEPVTNIEFTKTLALVLNRPAIFIIPATIVRLLKGQMANELILYSNRVIPKKLISAGYKFRFTTLEPAIKNLLTKRI